MSVKVVLVGDGGTEKSAFAVCWQLDAPSDRLGYIPTAFENYTCKVRVGDQEVSTQLWNTAGLEEMENIRALSYPDTGIFLLLFSYEDVNTLENIRSKWVPEISQYVQERPVLVLVGVRGNVRENYQELEARGESPFGESPVKDEMIQKVMRDIGADDFMECCPKINYSVRDTMARAVAIFLKKRSKERKKKKK